MRVTLIFSSHDLPKLSKHITHYSVIYLKCLDVNEKKKIKVDSILLSSDAQTWKGWYQFQPDALVSLVFLQYFVEYDCYKVESSIYDMV